ncbi:MAG: peptide chain release factor N(5)-glutamine methyltransferase [Selenomonas sp.]|uniref:peptide chain release factor N(5)-glutamine methyltransferase n=1 Tax=Selenomonas sp. TaxID=2053611 RepID=UPI0025D3029A|nr:peptide chain release factor N(5)-glutamine methyltransferase [Selenomonas sp.]MCI6232257.1 peptide chain release factor N(5)-glutamine methyltransferase [Selenomonas sp.]
MNEIWTIGRILKWTENFFKEKGIESPRLDAEVLLGHVLEKERIYLYVHFDEPLQPQELAEYREAIKQRIRRVPVAYIIGQREFMGLTFHVTEDTLVPRPDTEILVQAAIERLKKMSGVEEARPVRFADIGTGTGAICLSVLHYLTQATADTVDISEAARKVAEENAEALDVKGRITFYTGDLLAPLFKAQSGGAGDKASAAEETAGARYDAILSNPPYIPDADIETLAPEVRCKEPRTALAGGADGLDFYRRLVADSPALIKDDGFLAVEVGIHQAQVVAKMATESGAFARTEILKDYGGIERVVVVWKK